MTWNYRIVLDHNGSASVREVYYEDGVPTSYTENPITLGYDDASDLYYDLHVLSRIEITPLYLDRKGKIIV